MSIVAVISDSNYSKLKSQTSSNTPLKTLWLISRLQGKNSTISVFFPILTQNELHDCWFTMASGPKLVDMREVAKHTSEDDCWMVIFGKVYDLSSFLDEHPGGSEILLKYSGKDGSEPFNSIHSKAILSMLPKEAYIGDIDPSTIGTSDVAKIEKVDKSAILPPIDTMLNIFDFQHYAQKVMTKDGWDYYASGADDEITLRENQMAFSRIWFRPRVLVDVSKVDTRCKILGYDSSFPLYITTTALGKLAHPEGETVITRACFNENVIQMMGTLASCSMDEIMDAAQVSKGQTIFFQLYVNHDRSKTRDMIVRAMELGCRAMFITVDAPAISRRERDMRNKFNSSQKGSHVQNKLAKDKKDSSNKKDESGGVATALWKFIDGSLTWRDLPWFRRIVDDFYNSRGKQLGHPRMKIVLKGVQTAEDAVLAYEHGMDGIVVSNHGGRQLDFARSGIEALIEVMDGLRKFGYEKEKFEVFVDGGIRRGTDIFKALALGATAVGVGRPALYGLATYGQDGVERVLQMLRGELQTTMQMLGAPNLNDIKREMVITRNINDHMAGVPRNMLNDINYKPLEFASKL